MFDIKWAISPSYIQARTGSIQYNDDDVRFVLDQHYSYIDLYSASSLRNILRENMSLHLDTDSKPAYLSSRALHFVLSWNQSLVGSDRVPNPLSTALKVIPLTITPPMRFKRNKESERPTQYHSTYCVYMK